MRGNACLLLVAVCGTAFAAPSALYTNPKSLVGNMPHSYAALGLQFTVLDTPVWVTGLGAFDSGQDGFVGTVHVSLFQTWDRALIATQSLTGMEGNAVDAYRFKSLGAPILLQANSTYIVSMWGYSDGDPGFDSGGTGGGYQASDFNGGAFIDATGTSPFRHGSPWEMPDVFNWIPIRYAAGNVEFDPVPEPATLTVLALGALGFVRRRRA